MTFKAHVSLLLCLLVPSGGSLALAQTHLGEVRGRVPDPSGAAVPAAPYGLINESTNGSRQGASGGDGSFAVTQLQPGAYRLEAFNLFNHVNLGLPDNFFGSPTLGQITSAGAARRLQLGVKLLF